MDRAATTLLYLKMKIKMFIIKDMFMLILDTFTLAIWKLGEDTLNVFNIFISYYLFWPIRKEARYVNVLQNLHDDKERLALSFQKLGVT